MSNLDSYQHSVAQCIYHLQWTTKYRYNMFRQEKYAILCDTILRDVAKRHNMQVVELTVASDHIHAVVKAKPSMSSSECLRLLKGASSRELFKQVPLYRLRYSKGHFWSPGKFVRTVGNVDLETTNKYVAQQRTYTQTALADYAS